MVSTCAEWKGRRCAPNINGCKCSMTDQMTKYIKQDMVQICYCQLVDIFSHPFVLIGSFLALIYWSIYIYPRSVYIYLRFYIYIRFYIYRLPHLHLSTAPSTAQWLIPIQCIGNFHLLSCLPYPPALASPNLIWSSMEQFRITMPFWKST